MRLIDSHAHLAEEGFDADRDAVLARAREAGVESVVVIGYNVESSRRAVQVAAAGPATAAASSPALVATVGFAPHNVAEATPEALARVKEMLSLPRVVAVGEIGLDYHYDMPRPAQRELMGTQLGWAVERGLPVVIHSREAEDDVVALLLQHGAGGAADDQGRLRGVIHCFTESAAMAHRMVELGFYVSFSGILTFRSAADLRETAAAVPLHRTLIETDAPYLSPQRWRGKRNEPAHVVAVAECLAELHGVDVGEVAETTAANAEALFGLAEASG